MDLSRLIPLFVALGLCDSTGPPNYSIDMGLPPDFYTLDSVGRQLDSFQFFLPDISDPQYVIRGSEIACQDGLVVVRDTWPPDPDPCSGGWGSAVYTTTPEVDGAVVSFTVPLVFTDDITAYDVEQYRHGAVWPDDWCWPDFADCMSGPVDTATYPCTQSSDLNSDQYVDLLDFYLMQQHGH